MSSDQRFNCDPIMLAGISPLTWPRLVQRHWRHRRGGIECHRINDSIVNLSRHQASRHSCGRGSRATALAPPRRRDRVSPDQRFNCDRITSAGISPLTWPRLAQRHWRHLRGGIECHRINASIVTLARRQASCHSRDRGSRNDTGATDSEG